MTGENPVGLDLETIRGLPKVLLHDHLDGGLRPLTIIELARERKIELPSSDPEELEAWFFRGANRGSLPLYLEGFGVTCSLTQDTEALRRIALERVEDLAADGVVYAEIRFAPILHIQGGLNLEQVMESVLGGIHRGCEKTGIDARVIVCALRNMDPAISLEMAELAVDFRDRGVVGFDLAGDESGHPPKKHIEAFQYLRRCNFNITIHAGEAFGISSIWQAIQYCGAHRIGHATRLVEDFAEHHGGQLSGGTLAKYILDKRISLEMCLSSNLHTGAIEDVKEHPFLRVLQEGYRVTLNVDNYLMSATTLSSEWDLAQRVFGIGIDQFEILALNGAKGAFCGHSDRVALIRNSLLEAYADARTKLGGEGTPVDAS